MAAGLGFKEFTTGDVLTAADANGYLASQVVMVFADAAARTSAITSPQEGMISYLKDTNSTQYYSGSAWVAIGGGGGKVLQVVSANTSTDYTNNTSTYGDTGLTATITPSATSSNVLVFVTQGIYNNKASSGQSGSKLKLLRGATTIRENAYASLVSSAAGASELMSYTQMYVLDSPSTTSATTYKTQGASVAGNSSFNWGGNMNSTIVLMEIGA